MLIRRVAIDVETSDLSPRRGGRILEVAAVAIQADEVLDEFSTLIDVDCRINPGAQRVHGIDRRMLKGNPCPEEIWPQFLKFVGTAQLIAHNARFDLAFIRHELNMCDLFLDNHSICTLTLARKHFPFLQNHRLKTVAKHLLGEVPKDCQLHRALIDARLAAQIWMAINKEGMK